MAIRREALWKCQYCHKKFQQERAFLNHKCKLMIREEELRTLTGQTAWHFYQDWMRMQRKRVPDDRAFLKSHYYLSFMKFADFVKQTDLPTPQKFIKLMISEKYDPTMWLMDEVYVIYMEYLDKYRSPSEHFNITITTLDKKAEEHNCYFDEIFNHINASEVIELLRQRKLSPLVLLSSSKFSQFLFTTSKKNIEQFIILERLIRPAYWQEQFKNHENLFKSMKRNVAKVEL